MQCSDANSFTINPGTGGSATWAKGKIGSNCAEDYIGIEGKIIKNFKCYLNKMSPQFGN